MSRLGHLIRSGQANTPRYYAPTSFYNRPLGSSDTLAVDQTAAAHLANQMNWGRQGHTFQGYSGVGYGVSQWPYSMGFSGPTISSHPVYCVRPSDPSQNIVTQKVGLYYKSGSSYFAAGNAWQSGLQTYLTQVPIPDASLCPKITGTGNYHGIWSAPDSGDQMVNIWNLDTDEGYEFWVMTNNADWSLPKTLTGCEWNAQYSAYIPSMSKFSGIHPNNWGSRACSLGAIGGLITLQDVVNAWHGEPINHAIAIAGPYNDGGHVAPATRADQGGGVPSTIPAGYPSAGAANPAYGVDYTKEGQRFRLNPSYDITSLAARWPLAWSIAYAAQHYGICMVDTSPSVAFYIEDDRTIGSPYNMQGKNAIYYPNLTWPSGNALWDINDPTDWRVIHHIDWNQLQLLNPISS